MRLGITGTTKGATAVQAVVLRQLVNSFTFTEFHHGDAVGVDELGHNVVRVIRVRNEMQGKSPHPRIIIHPPVDDKKRAFCQNADEVREPEEYLVRDQHIVDEIDVLVALPETAHEVIRSGTWATVRYARKAGTILIIRVNPDGGIEFG